MNAKFQKYIDTGWINLNSAIKYRKINGIVYVNVLSSANIKLEQNKYTVVGTLPVGFRPNTKMQFVFHTVGSEMLGCSAYIDESGNIALYPYNRIAEYWGFSTSFPVA